MPVLDPGLRALAGATHDDPFSILGPHRSGDGRVAIRVIRPDAVRVDVLVVSSGDVVPARLQGAGLFEAILLGPNIPDYRLRVTFHWGETVDIDDPYRYGRVLTDFDLYL